jgi:hypothetical protein
MPMIIRQGSEWGVGSADSRAETEVTPTGLIRDSKDNRLFQFSGRSFLKLIHA